MSDRLQDYLLHVRRQGATAYTWADIRAWIDINPGQTLQPSPSRLSVLPPLITATRRGSIREIHDNVTDTCNARGWERAVNNRQRVTLGLAAISTAGILALSYSALEAQNMPIASVRIYLVIYGLMTFFMTSNFFKLILGTWHTQAGPESNPYHPIHTARQPRDGVRCAILFVVYHEDSARVAAGMAATWTSIVRHSPDLADRFDLMLLSDSRRTEHWVTEQAAVYELRRMLPTARIYYRHRASNPNSKMGNIADFCRRWGQNYEYMLVMDADSVMDGEAVVTLLRMMEGNGNIGILQTNPKPILRSSLFGRMQQFAGRLYGSVFCYGLQSMYMGNASYIGHNAMLRVASFTEHCMLPDLSGPKPWGGKPLSHDILESALMARAGQEVWFIPSLEGSYEELPANLTGFLTRERRWMQGNLQHIRFLLLKGLRPIHRETLIGGSMGYLSAPLWATFLLVSAFGLINFLHDGHVALGELKQVQLPMIMLLASSMVFLFTPRLLAVAINIHSDRARGYGGKDKLLWSVALETAFSMFFAPIIMAALTRFIWIWVKRRSVTWGAQQRDDAVLSWRECVNSFGWLGALGIFCWGGMVWGMSHVCDIKAGLVLTATGGWIKPSDLLLWYFPIASGFALSPFIARFTSRTFPWLREHGLFLTPEEQDEPQVIVDLHHWDNHMRAVLPDADNSDEAIRYALHDAAFYVAHRASTRLRPVLSAWLLPIVQAGARLNSRETLLALGERDCFDTLHEVGHEACPSRESKA